ncbi:ATP synthase subunit a [Candidatus Cyrtobacter comes]|uniref:ATP synthase subunit a n=1 Tax=Candidatus Cyrtobacter comes TaxID=675776 RepID=A0ABU5L823_9RICK|nr:F0F1 ATP synthase subunit A [Candidatus Cyrtobacter comes]MDZ5762272.1 ATP synthase subunit a [Candidatus Cyrtobacter comes]
MGDPLAQFAIKKVISFTAWGVNVSFTNYALACIVSVALILLFFTIILITKPSKTRKTTRSAALATILYEVVVNMIGKDTQKEDIYKFFPLIFTTFIFVLGCNIVGMIPFSFTVTSHIITTFALASFLFVIINVVGFSRHGLGYFRILAPEGAPLYILPLLVIVEFFAYIARPISLSIRLAANMMAGHIVLKVIAGFVSISGVFFLFPFALLTLLTGFEIFVAVLQAYIFAILSSVYLGDAINLH